MPIVLSGVNAAGIHYRAIIRDERNIYYFLATEPGSAFWNSRHYRFGSALCAESDEFDLFHGLNLARMKALAWPVLDTDTALDLFLILAED